MKKDQKSRLVLDCHSCNTIDQLKQQVRFTPVTDKRPYLKQWQNNPKTLAYCENEIKNGFANGYGLITGNGLLAIDFDGVNASKIAFAIGKWLIAIDTLAWTSGKPSRKQILVSIPENRLKDFEKLSRKALSCFGNVEAVENEQLEIRYNRCQSVLPPSAHPETNGYYWLREPQIEELNDYECNTILSALNTDTISDTKKYHGLTNSEQQLKLIESALEFIPNDNYYDWILVGMALFEDSYDCSLWNNWSSNSTKYKIGECEKTWQSFNGTGTTIRTLFWLAKQQGFNQKQWYRNNLPRYYKTDTIRYNLDKTYQKSSNEVNELDISKLIDDLVTRLSKAGVSEADCKLEVSKFCSQYHVAPSIIEQAINSRLKADYDEIEIDELKINFDDLISVPDEKLNLEYALNNQLLTILLNKQGQEIPTNPDALAWILLTMIAGIIGTKSRVKVKSKWLEPSILRLMIVGNSGDKKSPTIDSILEPLIDLDKKEAELYQLRYDTYLENLEEYSKTNKNDLGEKPKPPTRKRFIIDDFTIDGLFKAHKENPQGFLAHIDELYGYFSRMNKFYNGDDIQRDLYLYRGKAINKIRANEKSDIYLPKTAVSFVGSIQWVALKELLGNEKDHTGISSRWLIWCGNFPENVMNWDDSGNDLYNYIMSLVSHLIQGVNYTDLQLSEEAKQEYKAWHDPLMRACNNRDYLQLQYKDNKITGECFRIAQVLHYLDVASRFEANVSPFISGETMRRAIYFSNSALRHFAYAFDKSANNTLSGMLTKVYEIIKKKSIATANQVYKHNKSLFDSNQYNTQSVGELLLRLCQLGYCERIPTHKGVKVKIIDKG